MQTNNVIVSGRIDTSKIADGLYAIKGARRLTQKEIDLVNRIKDHAEATEALIKEVRALHLAEITQYRSSESDEQASLIELGQHWRARATDDLQDGFMKLVRSIERPTSFA